MMSRWPDGSLPDDVPPVLAEQLYLQARAGRARNSAMILTTAPGLTFSGRATGSFFDATFHAILDSRTDLARQLFPIAIAMADRARARLSIDLAAERFATRPSSAVSLCWT